MQAAVQEALDQVIDRAQKDRPLLDGMLNNEDMAVLYNLANGLYKSGQYQKSREIFQHLTLNKPFEVKNWQGLAAALQMEKNYTHALKAWALLAIMLEDDPLPHFHAADCLYMLGEIPQAQKALGAAENLINGSHPELQEKISALKTQWGQDGRS